MDLASLRQAAQGARAHAGLRRAAWIGGALVAAYALLGFFALPYALERSVPRIAAGVIRGEVSVGAIRFNPFTLTLDVRDVAIAPPARARMLHADHVVANLQLSSIFRRAWTLRGLHIDGLDATLAIEPDGRFNLAALARPDRPAPDAGARSANATPDLLIERLVVAGAKVTFADRTGSTPVSMTLVPLALDVVDLTTLRNRRGRYRLDATLQDGGTLHWQGDLALRPGSAAPLASSGSFDVHGFSLSTLWQFAADAIGTARPEGKLALAGSYRFGIENGQVRLALADGRLAASQVALSVRAGNHPLATLKAIETSGVSLDLAAHRVAAAQLVVRDGTISARIDADGALDWSTVFAGDEAPAKAPAWYAQIDAVHVENVALRYADHSRSPALALDVAHASADLGLAITTGTGTAGPDTSITGLRLALDEVSAADPAGDGPLAHVHSLAVEDGRVDTAARTVAAGHVGVEGAAATLARETTGAVGLLAFLDATRAGAARRRLEAIARQAEAEGQPWQYAIASIALKAATVAIDDRAHAPPLHYDVAVDTATLTGLDSANGAPAQLAATLSLPFGGKLEATGSVEPAFTGADIALTAQAVALAPLQPLIARYADLRLESGTASASMHLRYARGATPPLRVEGQGRIGTVEIVDRRNAERLVAWKALTADGIDYAPTENRLSIKEVRVQAPAATIAISAKRRLNLAQVLAAPPQTAPPAASESARSPAGKAFGVRIARVTFKDGTVDFSDQSLALPYRTHVRAVEGTILGISAAADSRAKVDLSGQIGEYGSASAAGRLAPAHPDTFTNLRVKFANVEMPPLSPYSATFAGRKIESGRLWLDLHYRIENGRLAGDNNIRAANLHLGERVKSHGALDLPLDLAVALLTGPDGVLEVAVPVSGDVGNPQFDFGQTIRHALANVVERIASAPFRILGGLIAGANGEEFRSIAFAPGRATLAPAEREVLDHVAKALRERPRLRLVVHGPYDPDRDAQALRREKARRAVAAELRLHVAPDARPGPLAFDDAQTQRAVERLFASDNGAGPVSAFAQDYERRSGKAAVRVGAADGAGTPAFYAAMFRHLAEHEALPSNALQDLAARRAAAVVDYLAASAGLESQRLETAAPRSVRAPDKSGVVATLDLGVMPGSS